MDKFVLLVSGKIDSGKNADCEALKTELGY